MSRRYFPLLLDGRLSCWDFGAGVDPTAPGCGTPIALAIPLKNWFTASPLPFRKPLETDSTALMAAGKSKEGDTPAWAAALVVRDRVGACSVQPRNDYRK